MMLLAKRPLDGRSVTLERHLRDTEACAAQLFASAGGWGKAWSRFFRLTEADAQSFLLHVRLAAIFHDAWKGERRLPARGRTRERCSKRSARAFERLGAESSFSAGVASSGRRHVDVDAVVAAVLSHHLKASEAGDHKWGQLHGASSVRLHLENHQVEACFARAAELLEIDAPIPKIGPTGLETIRRGLTRSRRVRKPEGR